jgi:Cu+-exporting ATPase
MAPGTDSSTSPTSAQPLLRQTTFLVTNLHCPSCVSHIERSLFNLQPKPSSISHSIVSHSVTVYHDPSLPALTISEALEEAGYEVYIVIPDPSSTDIPPFSAAKNGENRSTRGMWFERAVQRWKTKGRDAQNEEKKRKRHIEHCEMCRAEEKTDAKETLSPSSTEDEKALERTVDEREGKGRHIADASIEEQKRGDPFVVVDSGFSPAKIFQASISITGMTCSSCSKALVTLCRCQSSHQ